MDHEVPLLFVLEFQGYSLSGLDFCHLGHIIQQVARFCPDFLHHQARARLDVLHQEAARAVRHKLAVGVAHHGTVRGGDKKLNVTQRAAIAVRHLLDQQTAHGAVAEADVDDLLLLAGEVHGLGRRVDDVVPVTGELLHDISSLFQPRCRETAVF